MSEKQKEASPEPVSGSKSGFKKVTMPEVVKLENKGDVVSGEFIKIVQSQKYESSWGLHFLSSGAPFVVFINNAGKDLIESQNLKKGDAFILEHAGEKQNLEGTHKYTTYELFIK